MKETFVAEHDRMRALLAEFDTYLARDAAPTDERFATLRWTLVREHLLHSRRETAFLKQAIKASAVVQAHSRLSQALDDLVTRQVREWDGASIAAGWSRYRAATASLILRLRRQMLEEERTFGEALA
jgi:hypothetical protein